MRAPASQRRLRQSKPLLIFSLMLALAACAAPAATSAPTAPPPARTPTAPAVTSPAPPTATIIPATAPLPSATATAAPPTLTPLPPTAAPPRVALLSAQGVQTQALAAAVQQAAQKFGWQVDVVPNAAPAAVRAAAQAGTAVIVADGPELEAEARSAASQFPAVYFICLQLNASGLPPNVLALGDTPREDQAGFLAGMAAGFVTQATRVAVVGDPTSPAGLRYRNGFLHGVRYTCAKCRLDNIDVRNAADVAGTAGTAATYALYGVDVFFAAAGDAGDAALVKVTQAGAWGIGSGRDVVGPLFNGGSAAGADKILTSVYLDPAAAVSNALNLYHAGTPLTGTQSLSAATGALVLAPDHGTTGGLSALDRHDLAAMVTQLADGSFDTGIDPVTGGER